VSKHTSYRGATIDMDSMRRENEHVPAIGNANVNARGDKLGRAGTVAKTADQIARENHRVQSAVVQTGLKGPVPLTPTVIEQKQATPVTATAKKTVEKELPSGDIVIEEDKDEG
jgi:hypothetical protein